MHIGLRGLLPLAQCACLLLGWVSTCWSFVPDERWSTTASGSTGETGDPITLTWSFVPDGTNIPGQGASDLIEFLDATLGSGLGGADFTQRPWFEFFDNSFDRWSQLSGITFIYEPNDDGRRHETFPGLLGVRGDIRIGGTDIDGPSDTLAFNLLPDVGDMVLDTAETSFFGNSASNHLRLRNTVMHELGHGLGLLHIESNTDRFLLEPIISTAFDGPQFDDIRGVQWFYGDALEKSSDGAGNDSAASASDLGVLAEGSDISIGFDAGPDTFIHPLETDFVSIANEVDTDFFKFTTADAAELDITLTPLGATFDQGVQGGEQSSIDTSALSDLTLTVFDTNGSSILATANEGIEGESEALSHLDLPTAGTYFVSVTGTADVVQFYGLSLAITATASRLAGDYNGNGAVDAADYNVWRDSFGSTINLVADGNQNGTVDAADYNIWRDHFGDVATSGASLPEPAGWLLLVAGLLPAAIGAPRRRERQVCTLTSGAANCRRSRCD